MGFSGSPFTWKYGTTPETMRADRLDHGLCDLRWLHLFPSAHVTHLGHATSDHCPLLLQLQSSPSRPLGPHPFKFQAAWLTHPGLFNWMASSWECDSCLSSSLRRFATKLQAWNKDTFGNIFHRKKRNLLRLEGVQRAMGV